eukprot:gene24460-biopygen17922
MPALRPRQCPVTPARPVAWPVGCWNAPLGMPGGCWKQRKRRPSLEIPAPRYRLATQRAQSWDRSAANTPRDKVAKRTRKAL